MMPAKNLLAALVALVFASSAAYGQTAAPTPVDPDVERLIDQLTDASNTSSVLDLPVVGGIFMGRRGQPVNFVPPIMGPEREFDPAMVNLVRLGIRALPTLLAHLRDTRETKIVYDNGKSGLGAVWFSDEYQDRHSVPEIMHTVSHMDDQYIPGQKYTFRVGDLCYAAIGQIVNRCLFPMRYQPRASAVINSPVQVGAFADAVKTDWEGLTPEIHREQLKQDAYDMYSELSTAAVERLLFFYPDDGKAVAIRLLGRQLCDTGVAYVAASLMMKTDSAEDWQRIYRDGVTSCGEEGMAFVPSQMRIFAHFERNSKVREARADKITKLMFPWFSLTKAQFHNAASLDDQEALVRSLARFPDEDIDAAVQDLFVRTVKETSLPDEADERDRLTMTCFERMIGKGYDDQYLAYFRKRIAEIEKTPNNSDERPLLEGLKICVARIQKH
jgi:hypothetical protein